MVIQERDQEILRKISKYAVLSTNQIGNLLFHGVAHTTMMRRLRALEKAKYIHRGVPLDDGTNTWMLGLEGRRFLNQKPSFMFMNRNTIGHDVLLNDVRILLESLNLGHDWTPEWVMKSRAMRNDRHRQSERVIPDGLMIEPVNGKSTVFAMELERTRKSQQRYDKVLYQYSLKATVDVIWYITKDLSIANAVIEAGRERRFPMDRLWFSLEHQLFKERDLTPVWLPSEGKWIKLNQIGLDKLKAAQPPAHVVSRQTQEKTDPSVAANPANSSLESTNPQETEIDPQFLIPPPQHEIGGKGSGTEGREEGGEKKSEYKQSG
jgi:hypothetical protein